MLNSAQIEKPAPEKEIQKSFFDFLIENLSLTTPVQVCSGDWGKVLVSNFVKEDKKRCFYLSIQTPGDEYQALDELTDDIGPEDIVLVAIPAIESGKAADKKRMIASTLNCFSAKDFHLCGRFALNPDPTRPHIVFDLQPHILAYVEVVSHRCGDRFLKFIAKKAKVAFLGISSWSGWEIAVLRKKRDQFSLPQITDRYVFLTPDREIALVFGAQGRFPTHVEKKGHQEALAREWQNHQWAARCLGPLVPALYDFSPEEGRAVMKMEYIPEKNLPNVVSEALFRRCRLEKETLATLDFFQGVFTRFEKEAQAPKEKLNKTMQAEVTQGLAFACPGGDGREVRTRLEKAFTNRAFPLIPQHGDFCVRNVLYRNARQMVLIDWEDFNPACLPLVDLNMLCISLAETWAQIGGGDGRGFISHAVIQKRVTALSNHMREKLDVSPEEWRICGLLSLVLLVGINVRKNRLATAMKIRDEFLRQLELFDF